jgi:hypothetical protein
MSGVMLDVGALIAFERNDRAIWAARLSRHRAAMSFTRVIRTT